MVFAKQSNIIDSVPSNFHSFFFFFFQQWKGRLLKIILETSVALFTKRMEEQRQPRYVDFVELDLDSVKLSSSFSSLPSRSKETKFD